MLTIAIPTIGRPTLARCVFSFIEQLEPGDNVLFVADPKGDVDYVRWVYKVATNRLGVNWRISIQGGQGGWGQDQRNHAYNTTDEGHIWCLSDDDIATPDAVEAIRHCANATTNGWFLFRAGRANANPWVWTRREVETGNLDADCIVAPASTPCRWGLGYEGDAGFALHLLANHGPPVFMERVVAVTKPNDDYLEEHYRRLSGFQGLVAQHVEEDPAELDLRY
jgi:hypothetical protein